MTLTGLLDALAPDPAVTAVLERAGKPELDLSAPPGMRPFLLATLAARTGRTVLAVTATSREAEDLVDALQSLLPTESVVDYPAWETLPHERLSPRADTVGRRLAVLRRMRHPRPDDPASGPVSVVVAPVRSVLQPQVPGLGDLEPLELRVGDETDFDDAVRRLAGVAATRVDMVERRGEFAVRGGILDVFPPTEEHPLRVEFWGDTVEEVRWFKVADQRSLEVNEHGLWAPPCRELLLTNEVRDRARALAIQHPELAEMLDRLAEGVAVEGMESLAPVLVGRLSLLPDRIPAGPPVGGRAPHAGPARCGVRPRAVAGPRRRPGSHERGVPRGVVGGCRRWRRGAGGSRRCRVANDRRRPRALPRARCAVVVGEPVHQRRGTGRGNGRRRCRRVVHGACRRLPR